MELALALIKCCKCVLKYNILYFSIRHILYNFGNLSYSDILGPPKPRNQRGTTPNFKTQIRTQPRKAEPETTLTLDFNYKTPKSKGDVPEMLIPEPDPDFCSPNTSLVRPQLAAE